MANVQKTCDVKNLPVNAKLIKSKGTEQLIYRKGDTTKFYLPNWFATKVIGKLHIEKRHIGFKQLELQFIRKYYNPQLPHIIKEVIRDCEVCQLVSIP